MNGCTLTLPVDDGTEVTIRLDEEFLVVSDSLDGGELMFSYEEARQIRDFLNGLGLD